MQEYRKLPKGQQDNIKDVGGFVGGELRNGIRKKDTVVNRCMLSLDADYADDDFWEQIELFFDFRCLIYSTHKHTPERPRLRLIIPLSRPVTADEHTAIARRIAADIGIEQFDDTTYQPHRLMYWASRPLTVSLYSGIGTEILWTRMLCLQGIRIGTIHRNIPYRQDRKR